jgi:non-ribosomal peptide synthetase-like protein
VTLLTLSVPASFLAFTLLSQGLGSVPLTFTSWTFYRDMLSMSLLLFFGVLLARLAFVFTVPRLLNLGLKPGKVYPLYGWHYWLQRTIARTTNSKFFNALFGDSAYIVSYLRCLGYHLSKVIQTGTNFGMTITHENPYATLIGSGTMVSDGLSIINADFSSTSFRVSPVTIGAHNFLGNNIAYPSEGKTGENCLLATKVLVPVNGPVREGVGLLGSPCFEIPRSVLRDSRFDHLKQGDELRRRLGAKTRYNTVTIAWFLLVRWFFFFAATLLSLWTMDLSQWLGAAGIAGGTVLSLGFSVCYFVLIERITTGFRALQPQFCSIYDPYFWRHERYWKVPSLAFLRSFNGTPFKSVILRLLGVRVGHRVFDDGCHISERTLVTIGDDCTLNDKCTLQSHSLEDGTFKSDHITLGKGATIGVNAFVHYGVAIGDGAVLGADSFLMKGEQVPSYARWQGNPAREMREMTPLNSITAAPQVTRDATSSLSRTHLQEMVLYTTNSKGKETHL